VQRPEVDPDHAEVIRRANSSGTAIPLATHAEAVVEVADRVLAMEDGRVNEARRAETPGLPS